MDTREQLERLGPFNLKDVLIRYARDYSHHKSATHVFLNAGRGNPNWVATTPREAFFVLGQFAIDESKRTWDERDLGGMPHADQIADRFDAFLARTADTPGARLLRRAMAYAARELGFKPDAFVHELVDGCIGDTYPVPDRMLAHAERVVHRYLEKVMCDDRPPDGRFDLFATEGGTAAMCYVFKSLEENRILRAGDTIALGTPIFTPYIELPHLSDFALETIDVVQARTTDGRHLWQYTDAELAKLEDPRVKVFFLVNPSNPASFAMADDVLDRIVQLVRTKRQDLLIVTDDVYGTFVDGFRSLAAELPHNTILVYSFSKHFGCTGWRLGVVAMHEDHLVDRQIARLPERDRAALAGRYQSVTTHPAAMRFIDRMVADSRDIALMHTAGLSCPQQVQMTLFSLFALTDEHDAYERRCREIVHERFAKLVEGLGVEVVPDPHRVAYYADLDLEAWGRRMIGDEFVAYFEAHEHPIDIVLGLAKRHGTVLLGGGGFEGPSWSVRISLANLDADDYLAIGRDLHEIATAEIQRWRASQRS